MPTITKNKKDEAINIAREIQEVCSACGITANYLTCLKKYGRPPEKKAYSVSTYHTAECDLCGEVTGVTQTRDFFHPDFSLIIKLMKPKTE